MRGVIVNFSSSSYNVRVCVCWRVGGGGGTGWRGGEERGGGGRAFFEREGGGVQVEL